MSNIIKAAMIFKIDVPWLPHF